MIRLTEPAPPPTIDERLHAVATAAAVRKHLESRGWRPAPGGDAPEVVAEHGPLALYTRARPDGTTDHTAVPLDAKRDGHAAALCRVLAASAARDGLDLAQIADALGG